VTVPCDGCGTRVAYQHAHWCPETLRLRGAALSARVAGIVRQGAAEIAEVEAKPDASVALHADEFARGARFASQHVGAALPTLSPLLDAAARHRNEGAVLGRQQAAEVLDHVLAQLAQQGGPADIDVLRKVREHVAAEFRRRFGRDVIRGDG